MAEINTVREPSVGVFDSGLGGLSILADLIKSRPGETYCYFADAGYAPYGGKSRDMVRERVLTVAAFLQRQGLKVLVVACNTATSAAVEEMRRQLLVPVVGMEPALKKAVNSLSPQRIVVAATPLTLREEKFKKLFVETTGIHEVIPLPCPGLVEIIEREGPDSPGIEQKLASLLQPVLRQPIDQLVLGCTHYVLIKNLWQKAVGPITLLVDGNEGTVRQTLRLLEKNTEPELKDRLPVISGDTVRLFSSSTQPAALQRMKELLVEQLLLRGMTPDQIKQTIRMTLEEECT